ncbi:MAG: RraA family protein [Vicinamibacterales bacterium]
MTDDHKLLEHLARFDTPTICNALELATGSRRAAGFTREQMVAGVPGARPMVGFARTATLRASAPSILTPEQQREIRLAYYEYVASNGVPTIAVIQDLDQPGGIGAFWGEVNSKVHAAIGVRGVITDGAVRDLADLSPSLPILGGKVTPSHAFVRIESIGEHVSIFGMDVAHDDLIHADRHGAVVIPAGVAPGLPAAIDLLVRRERLIIDAAARPGFDVSDLRRILAEADDIH